MLVINIIELISKMPISKNRFHNFKMVSMRCIDFTKEADKTSRYLGIISFILIFISSFGYLMVYCDWAKNAQLMNNKFHTRCQSIECPSSNPQCNERRCSKEFKKQFHDYFGVVGTTCALAISSFVAWLVWTILFNFGISDSFCSIMYYISFVLSFLLLIFIIATYIFVPLFFYYNARLDNDFNLMSYGPSMDILFYMLLVGIICSFIVKTSDGQDSVVGSNKEIQP